MELEEFAELVYKKLEDSCTLNVLFRNNKEDIRRELPSSLRNIYERGHISELPENSPQALEYAHAFKEGFADATRRLTKRGSTFF